MTRMTNSVTKSSQQTTIKFLYSYAGKILPRHTDGNLRYVGGHTRVLAVDRSVTYAELIVKLWESCGFSVNLKCKLPSEDLDVLVSVSSDEDLAAVIEEYDRVSPYAKIRAVLFPMNSLKTISPVPSVESLVDFPATKPLTCPRRQQHRRYSVARSSRFSQVSNPKSLFCYDSNTQWLNRKQLGGR
ncbi:putative PB1 domain-containing protein [Helianthus annuus]|nr:putative PB1 domain-containing protein [Helianthus annuus]KAJ0578360.1 putative PB1 domain-containing protein [Helianthus annuus]KAJ0748157.1 putative PB1 domain-containing protein [Helianthus annuus]